MKIDYTLPGKKEKKGHIHPISKAIFEIEDIFSKMGFEIILGPEIDTEYNNFDKLNIPKSHPARDMQDTFWIKGLKETVLRTHTSNSQSRYMGKNQPPIKIISPGRVFRNETPDATHEAQFHQCEGLVVAKNISLANLKETLDMFLKEFFGTESETRFRPGYFPFVEPGIEVDIACFTCSKTKSKECPVCKGSGWIELLGAGMVHPKVLNESGISPELYQGYAFGMGLERLIMLKYGVESIRNFYDGNIPFLKQF